MLAASMLVAAAPPPGGAVATGAAPRVAPLPVTGFAYGSYPHRQLRREADGLATVTVVGSSLRSDGRGVTAPDAAAVAVGRVARAEGLHTELLVSNYSDRLGGFDARRLHRLLSDDDATDAVVRRLARLVAAGGWGGVNVDLELVRRGDAAGLVRLCERLQDAMPPARTVTIDISASTTLRDYRARGYDLRGIAAAVDRIELMAYDQHGPGWSGPGPVGALSWQRRAVLTMLRAVPAGTVDLGVAGYGYVWTPDGGATVTPRVARARARAAGVRPVWHPRAGEWSARLPGGRVMWWSDARSWRLRVALARRLGVHGLALWRLGSADPLPPQRRAR